MVRLAVPQEAAILRAAGDERRSSAVAVADGRLSTEADRGRRPRWQGVAQTATSRDSRCLVTLRFTRCRALSTVLVSQSRSWATSS